MSSRVPLGAKVMALQISSVRLLRRQDWPYFSTENMPRLMESHSLQADNFRTTCLVGPGSMVVDWRWRTRYPRSGCSCTSGGRCWSSYAGAFCVPTLFTLRNFGFLQGAGRFNFIDRNLAYTALVRASSPSLCSTLILLLSYLSLASVLVMSY